MTVDPIPVPLVTAVLSDLATCLCAQILADGLPPVCTCGVMPGAAVALDYAGECNDVCGMAWVRLGASYPSVTIGQPSARPGNCGVSIGIDVEMGLIRCIDLGDGENPPDPAELTAAAVLQQADMMAMWRAVACCRQAKDWVIGQYVPYGPEGGLVGGMLPLSILLV
jgi:hypothetical protein